MDEPPPAIRRVCVSVDLTGADDVARLLGHADAPSKLRRDRWLTQATGAGEIALLPPGIDEGKVLPALVRVLRQAGSTLDPGAHLRVAIHQLVHPFIEENLSAVVGMEARGFIFGSLAAWELGVGFVPLRKPSPWQVGKSVQARAA